jgi:SET domain-containing protein
MISQVPLYKALSKIEGFGAFASRRIEKDSQIAIWDGPYAHELPNDASAKYYLYVRPHVYLVGFGGDYPESFINHSSNPNSKIVWDGDIAILVAIRDI